MVLSLSWLLLQYGKFPPEESPPSPLFLINFRTALEPFASKDQILNVVYSIPFSVRFVFLATEAFLPLSLWAHHLVLISVHLRALAFTRPFLNAGESGSTSFAAREVPFSSGELRNSLLDA